MLKNDLTMALRQLRKRRGHAFINIFGLSLGVAAATLILLFARNELTYDRFHTHAEDTYLVYKERITPTGTQATYDTWVPLLDRLEGTFPSITNGTRTSTNTAWVQHANQRFQEQVTYVDPSFFEVFSFPLVAGSTTDPLPSTNAMVISQDLAHKYFGDADPLGQVLTVDYQVDYTVTGVLGEVPPNSTLRPEILLPITSSPDYASFADEWGSSFLSTYIRLGKDARVEDLEAQFPAFIASIWDEEVASRTNFKLLPLLDAYDTFTGNRQYAYILLGIALAIILIACINFINLATARSLERAREIGVRKVLGARRGQVIKQLLAEFVLLGLFALVIGVAMAQALLPLYNRLYETTLRLNDPWMLAGLLGLGLIVGLLAGSYPVLVLSRFHPARSLRGTFTTSRQGLHVRHSLVVLQFALSILLIAGTGIMWKQVQYMKDRDLAFDKNNVLVLPVEVADFADPEEAAVRLHTFKEELARLSGVQAVSSSARIPGDGYGGFLFARPEGGNDEQPLRMQWTAQDAHFFTTYDIQFVEGRDFIPGSEADRDGTAIINEAALRAFGWTTLEGQTVRAGGGDREVIGVVEDYNFESLLTTVRPLIHFYRPSEATVHNYVSVKLQSTDYAATMASVEAAWNRLDPTRAFEYFFVDDNFDQLYQTQDRLVTVAGAFAILAIVIACLGLFGLAALMVTQRTKEIGIRKVLGASVPGITLLLSKDFARLVLVAFVVGAPLAYFTMNTWLDGFAYRVEISWWIFLWAGLAALGVALVTVSYQAIRAALADPVESLRYE